jgi:hypothetical protein
MAWEIENGPYDAPWGGRDAVGWGWILTNERGDRHVLTVWVSGTAMAVAPEFLPDVTAEARATQGRSEAEKMLADEILPREVMLGTAGRSVVPDGEGWWVELQGEQRTLSALVRLFAEGDPTIVRRGGQVFLRATDFEEMADEQEVRLRAAGFLREAIGAAWLEGEQVGQVEVAAVRRVA